MSLEYHKINSIFKRDPSGKTILWGEYAQPEFAYLADNQWVFTEKVDGTNIRVMWDGEHITFGGKTDNAQLPAPLFQRLHSMFSPIDMATTFDGPACLYGEGYGAGIQKGGKYSPTPEFVLFDVQVGEWWLLREQVEAVALSLGCKVVPIVGYGTLGDMIRKCESAYASAWGDFPAEGIVARPGVELRDRAGRRVITKFKLRDFDAAGKERT